MTHLSGAFDRQGVENVMPDSITITVRDDHLSRIDELADQLCAAGMRVRHVLSTVGIITGEVTSVQRSAIVNN